MRRVDLTGKQFGHWTVISLDEKKTKKKKQSYWFCKCGCGNEKSIYGCNLKRGLTTNCGCIQREKNKSRMSTHGKSDTKIYGIWLALRRRCYNSNVKDFENYGGRGIKVCESWKDDFNVFYKWSLENGYKEGLSIDRVDNNGDYEPSNCRWVTRLDQNNNKRNTVYITIGGKSKTITEWAKVSGLERKTIATRYRQGWRGKDLLLPNYGVGTNQFNTPRGVINK